MNRQVGCALVLGAASKLGSTLVRLLAASKYQKTIIAADKSSKQPELKKLRAALCGFETNVEIAEYLESEHLLGFEPSFVARMKDTVSRVFHVALNRDRTQNASQVGQTNKEFSARLFELVARFNHLSSIVVVTDVGLAGDYPGRFSESWVDVGQTPFDEVDRSSMEVELMCLDAQELPISRARVGLLSDLPDSTADAVSNSVPAAKTLIPFINVLRKLPRFLKVPVYVSKESLAPLTPTVWAASSLIRLSENQDAIGRAFHMVLSPPPAMFEVLRKISATAGGAGLKRGLSIGYGKLVDALPGLTETTKRQADQMASWWTPHRYCLSRNDLDVSNLEDFLRDSAEWPSWRGDQEAFFFQTFV